MHKSGIIKEKTGIGIDTGGTCTDSVIVGLETGKVISKAKAPTTHGNLCLGIRASLEKLEVSSFGEIELVALSTTLATNSVVENRGARAGLVIAVPYPSTFKLQTRLPCKETALIAGSHNHKGEENIPLDKTVAQNQILRMAPMVDAFAVSGYFSIYNAAHENTLRQLIFENTDKPVVCAHELSGAVGMVERAVTAILNARLLPVIQDLIRAVKKNLKEMSIHAPLMVVKGDGSMMSAEACLSRPVETALSGPAASISAACRLSGIKNALALDMGGTTTDIAVVHNGKALVSKEGARVGGWQTRIPAVDMCTVGLGGDSRIALESGKKISIGPRRVIPFSHAGTFEPSLGSFLESQLKINRKKIKAASKIFFTLRKLPRRKISETETRLVTRLDNRVLNIEGIRKEISPFLDVHELARQGILMEVGFTATDLLHTTGQLRIWDRKTAEAALLYLAHIADEPPAELQERIKREFDRNLAFQIAAKCLQEDKLISKLWDDKSQTFLNQLLGQDDNRLLSIDFFMKKPIVAVGAPVYALMPGAAKRLKADLVIAPHAEVANAYGAITGMVMESVSVLIRPASPEGYVMVAPGLQKRSFDLTDAVKLAEEYSERLATERVIAGGGKNLKTDFTRENIFVPVADGWGDPVMIDMKVTATVSGSPTSGQRPDHGLSEPTGAEARTLKQSLPVSDENQSRI